MPMFPMTIAGRATQAADTVEVLNPATGAVLEHAPACSPHQLDDAMNSAQSALREWGSEASHRRAFLADAAQVLEKNLEDLASILTAEQGKPLVDARREISMARAWLQYYAELDEPRELVEHAGRAVEILRRPVGVVAAITPWNFPVSLAMWKIAPALRAGNTMVLKPSPYTPLTTLAIGQLFAEILPPGVLNVVSGAENLGPQLTTHPIPRKVSFTGSTETGKRVAEAAASDLKRLTLELGGNDPAIVLDDADVGAIAEDLFWGAFKNNGQICLAIKRVYTPRSLHDDLVEALRDIASKVIVGEGTEAGVQLGPVNNKPQLARVTGMVEDARRQGATVFSGGQKVSATGYFFPPHIISGISDGARIVDEEQFGPALPIVSYSNLDDAIARANRGMMGLTASVWTNDVDAGAGVARQLDCGQVSVNSHGAAVLPQFPFSGHKWSGLGVENGSDGLREYTEPQVISIPDTDR